MFITVPGCEERSPEPKPRWNPKPEQIRILEAIFNSGMVNPPRDEIRKIRAQLQEFGQVGDANVFYWFQNRKSRSKHKQLHQQAAAKSHAQTAPVTAAATATVAAPSTSSSSSEKSPTRRNNKSLEMGGANVIEASNSPTASVNQAYFQPHGDFSPEPFFFHMQQPAFSHGFSFSDLSNLAQFPDQAIGPCSAGLLLGELVNQGTSKRDEQVTIKPDQQLNFTTTATAPITNTISSITSTGSTTLSQLQGA